MKIKGFKDWSIFAKIISISVVTLTIFSILIMGWFLPMMKKCLMDEKYLKTRNLVESTFGIMENYAGKVKEGKMTEEEARKAALSAIKIMRYDKNEYFWINDTHPKMVMHPIKPEMNGTDVSDNQDSNGKRFFLEMAKVARDRGEGNVDYMWPKPNTTIPVSKISYVKYFKPWDWVLGSGIYVDDVQAQVNQMRHNVLLALGVCFAIILGLALIISKAISQPLQKAVEYSNQLALGDLDLHIKSETKDETGRLLEVMGCMVENLKTTAHVAGEIAAGNLNVKVQLLSEKDVLGKTLYTMVEKLRMVVKEIKLSSRQVAQGSQELSAAAEQISQGAVEQAASAEQASTSIEEMSSSISNNASHALETETIAKKASVDVNEGGQVVKNTVQAMKTISERISVVEEIARQTNLLALNAAIEAARAGDQGKGFAVVAAEVRKLAERSQDAAQEITKMTSGSVSVAENAGILLEKIVPDIQKTSELIQDISMACREQNSGAGQINMAIQELNKVIQQNSGASEEMASTAEELSSQAVQMEKAIDFFQIDTNEDFGSSFSASPPIQAAQPKVKEHRRARQVRDSSLISPAPYQPQPLLKENISMEDPISDFVSF